MTELHKFQTRKTPGLRSLNGDYVELTPIDWAEHGAELELSIFGDENAELCDGNLQWTMNVVNFRAIYDIVCEFLADKAILLK